MGIITWIKHIDRRIADDYAGTPLYFQLSPTRLSLTRVLFPRIETYIHGRCLDAGAGRSAYQPILIESADTYVSLDINWKPGLHTAGSLLHLPFQTASFDSIVCSQVLEHVPEPQQAIMEMARCLKPGGVAIFTVPHLSYLHNEPHDYFRFTKHGLRHLMDSAGLDIIEITPAGGLLSFLGHIASLIGKALLYPIPVFGPLGVRLNAYYARFVVMLDRRVDKQKLYALNYVAVGKKTETQS